MVNFTFYIFIFYCIIISFLKKNLILKKKKNEKSSYDWIKCLINILKKIFF